MVDVFKLNGEMSGDKILQALDITAPDSSSLGMVSLFLGAILLFDMINVTHHSPEDNFHLI